MISDSELFQKVKSGEGWAFDELYGRYKGPLMGFLRGYLTNPQECEEVFQEIFLSLLTCEPLDFSKGNFSGWLFTVARNRARNRLREGQRAQRKHSENEIQGRGLSLAPSPLEQMEESERMALREQALTQLPNHLLGVLELGERGLSQTEIAEQLAVPLGTIKSRLFRIREILGGGK